MKLLSTLFVVITGICAAGVAGFIGYKLYYKKTYPSYKLSIEQLQKVPNLIPIAIIGGGPAGLSAALFTTREHYHTVVFQGPKPGGMLSDTAVVENWPGILQEKGGAIMQTLEKQVSNFGGVLVPESIEKIQCDTWPYTLTSNTGTVYHAMTIIVATGTSARRLHIPGEDTYWGKGVAVCTQCDGLLTKGQDVVVVGGGETAVSHALHLAPHAKKITLVFMDDELDASWPHLKKLKEHKEIDIIPNSIPIEIHGDGTSITSITINNIKTNVTKEIPTQWVFLGIGYDANSCIVYNLVKRNKKGIIELAPYTQETSMPAIFAAGKVANSRYKLGAIASGDGIKAGLDAVTFLEDRDYDVEALQPLESHWFKTAIHARRKPQQRTKSLQTISSQKELDAFLTKNKKPALLEFFSPSCPHCQAMKPIVQELAQEQAEVAVAQCDINKGHALTDAYAIRRLPTFILFENGKEKARTSGSMSKQELNDFIRK